MANEGSGTTGAVYANGRTTHSRLHYARQAFLLMVAPGAGIRRWLLLGATGGVLFGLGIDYLIRYYTSLRPPDFLPWNLEGFLLAAPEGGLSNA